MWRTQEFVINTKKNCKFHNNFNQKQGFIYLKRNMNYEKWILKITLLMLVLKKKRMRGYLILTFSLIVAILINFTFLKFYSSQTLLGSVWKHCHVDVHMRMKRRRAHVGSNIFHCIEFHRISAWFNVLEMFFLLLEKSVERALVQVTGFEFLFLCRTFAISWLLFSLISMLIGMLGNFLNRSSSRANFLSGPLL